MNRRFLAAAASLALVAACAPAITVNAADTTPPSLNVLLVQPEALGARYDPDGPELSAVIDPGRTFTVYTRTDRQRVGLLFDASDGESGIGKLTGELTVRFTCVQDGGTVDIERTRTFAAEPYDQPTPHGGSTEPNRVTGAGFTLEGLWRGANCHVLGTSNTVGGQIRGVMVRYTGTATNNAVPPLSLPSPATGTFNVAATRVTVDP